MKMYHLVRFFIVFAILFSSCSVSNNAVDQETQDSTALEDVTPINPPETPAREITATSPPEINPCELVVEEIADSVLSFTWADQAESIFFSQDPEMLVWKEYPDQNNLVDVRSVFPVLQDQVMDVIQFLEPNYPAYSISPSGEKVVFWENAYTKPTPTPAEGEVSLTEFEWLLDLYLFTAAKNTQILVSRVEGGIVDVYWSKDETFVYLLFDQLQIPGDNFLVQIDLIEGDKKVILPDIQGRKYDNWIASSPDGNLLAFKYREDPTTVQIMNLDSGEVDQVTNLPDFDILFWAIDDLWILVKNSKEAATFIVFDSFSQEIVNTYDFRDRVGVLFGLNKPIMAPYDKKLAFLGNIDPKSYLHTLFTLSLCESD